MDVLILNMFELRSFSDMHIIPGFAATSRVICIFFQHYVLCLE